MDWWTSLPRLLFLICPQTPSQQASAQLLVETLIVLWILFKRTYTKRQSQTSNIISYTYTSTSMFMYIDAYLYLNLHLYLDIENIFHISQTLLFSIFQFFFFFWSTIVEKYKKYFKKSKRSTRDKEQLSSFVFIYIFNNGIKSRSPEIYIIPRLNQSSFLFISLFPSFVSFFYAFWI